MTRISSDLNHNFQATSFGIVYNSSSNPTILSICKGCNAKKIYLSGQGEWFEINNKKYVKEEFFNLTCEEFIIKGLLE